MPVDHEGDNQPFIPPSEPGFTPDLETSKRPFSVGQLILGFIVGGLFGVVCLAIDVFLALLFASTHVMFLSAVITLGILLLVGWGTLKRARDTAFIRGVIIALSLAAIIATACGVAMGSGPLRFN